MYLWKEIDFKKQTLDDRMKFVNFDYSDIITVVLECPSCKRCGGLEAKKHSLSQEPSKLTKNLNKIRSVGCLGMRRVSRQAEWRTPWPLLTDLERLHAHLRNLP